MPIDKLQSCREFLENAYRVKLGIKFATSIAEIGKGRQPIWRTVADDDLTSELQPMATGAAGLLLDPEIGLLAYILPFHSDTVLRKHIKRALALRSQLSIERNYTGALTDSSDSRGAWRVAVHWLVDFGAKQAWIDQIMDVRRETGFSEEITFDAIFLTAGNVEAKIKEYGFPRLLLTTREVLKKQRIEEMTHWLSANKLVERALADFSQHFQKPEQRELANEVVRTMQTFLQTATTNGEVNQAPNSPQAIHSIGIRDFRNLRSVQFDFGPQPVSASIIHGPNGTGKSSLCEAISVALFQSSARYKWFADRTREKDVTATDRTREYVKMYLSPIEDQHPDPRIALNEQAFRPPLLVEAQKTEDADLAMSGTILTQDASIGFTRMPAHELGAHVLRGYSALADHIEEFTESRVNQADAERQGFLRGVGLSTAITRIDTAYERIAKQEFDKLLPPLPGALIAWLEKVGKFTDIVTGGLPFRWRTWGDDASRKGFADEVASVGGNREQLIHKIRDVLHVFNVLALGSAECVKNINARISPVRHELGNAAARITAWGEWLEKHAQATGTTASPESDAAATSLLNLQVQQKDVLERGRSAGAHFDHLTQVGAFIRENWSKQHPDDCPTCGTNHSEHGGILKVVELLQANTAAERERLREAYSALKIQIDGTQKRLTVAGQAECPLSAEEQSSLAEALLWLIPEAASLPDWISVKTQRDTLLVAIVTLSQMPQVPACIDVESEGDRIAERVHSVFKETARIFEAPANWKPVRDKLTDLLARIVNEHLPNTLERLWRELALNLTSAPWLLPAEGPRIDVVTRRHEQTSTVRVKDRLARYILNQAEIHTLGLAWFFTRYLTRGRFFHACMVMDDPAHELDQTSFRDLCRLWETMMRLHRVYSRPLKLIVMLNQESRALDAARATGGILAILGWERDQEKAMPAISVIGEGFHAPQPAGLFEKTRT